MLLNNKSRTVKLIDFGLSRKVMPGAEVSIGGGNTLGSEVTHGKLISVAIKWSHGCNSQSVA